MLRLWDAVALLAILGLSMETLRIYHSFESVEFKL